MPKCYKWSQIVTAGFSLVGIVSVDQKVPSNCKILLSLLPKSSQRMSLSIFHKAAKEKLYKLQADNNPPAEEPSCFSFQLEQNLKC